MCAFVMRQSLPITGAITRDDALKFLPVDIAKIIMASRLIPAEIGVGHLKTDGKGLLYSLIHELLSQFIITSALDLPFHRLGRMRRLTIMGAKHHQGRPPPAVQRILRHSALRLGAQSQRFNASCAIAR